MSYHKELTSYIECLCEEETYEELEGFYFFKSGGSCTTCTDSALKIARKFNGKVYGYDCTKNPEALIGVKYCSGHDFAMVAERYIVDYWAFRFIPVVRKPVFDIAIELDRAQVRRLYGNRDNWVEVDSSH